MKGHTLPGIKQRASAIDAIKEVKVPDTKHSNQYKSKMDTEREIYKAKLRGDYQDLTGGKLKKASYDDPTGTAVSRDPHYLDSPAKIAPLVAMAGKALAAKAVGKVVDKATE
tara:strand:+ start:609 stop:944 length:336 start_codon:yes stop_codon:yes gene_type:complete